jgi:hypothetical protein
VLLWLNFILLQLQQSHIVSTRARTHTHTHTRVRALASSPECCSPPWANPLSVASTVRETRFRSSSNILLLYDCVACVCVRARVFVDVCVCMCECVCLSIFVHVRICSHLSVRLYVGVRACASVCVDA